MAKHKRHNKSFKKFKSATLVAASVPAIVLLSTSPAQAQPASAWNPVMQCESGTQNIESFSSSSSASGYFQIVDSTWVSAGGTEFAPRAIDASFEQQAIVAQRIAERRGSLADWNASQGCWGGSIDSSVPDGPATLAVTPAPVVEAPPVASPVAAAPVSADYVVQPNDTVIGIATAHGLDWQALAQHNGLVAPYIIHPGQVLDVSLETQYTVESGDTLSGIAVDKLGLPSWEPLYQQNIDVIGPNPDLIFPGQVFFVDGLPIATPPVVVAPVEEASVVTGVSFTNPVPGGVITSGYGPRGSEFHNGIDIDGAKGDPIVAAAAGQVVAAACGIQGFECWVRIRDIDGYVHTYGHMNDMSMIHVVEGQWVEAGTHIADVGNGGIVSSGGGDGSHLHYRITDGEGNDALPFNPETWLSDRGVVIPWA